MQTPDRGSHELDELFRAYRAACPDPEPGANFMPQLWQRIESRQTFSSFMIRMAGGFATAAVALTLLMAAYLYMPPSNGTVPSQTYVEALAASYAPEDPDLIEPVYFETSDLTGTL